MNLTMTGPMIRKLLIIVPVILALTVVSLFMPARHVTIEGIGRLSFETAVTLSVGSEPAYASPGDWTTPSAVYNKCGENTGKEAIHAIDDNETTQWGHGSNTCHHWIIFDMGETKNITQVRIYGGDSYLHDVDCYVSDDPENWGTAVFTDWDMEGSQWHYSPTFSASGRYIRLANMHGEFYSGLLVNDFYEFDACVEAACSEDISNTPSTHNFGTVSESSTYTTGLTTFTVTNNSGGAIDISIKGTDMTGGTPWTLSDSCTPGPDTYGLKAGLDGGDYTIIVKKNSPYENLVENLADSATQDWGLKLYTPTSFSDGVAKSGTVTLTATCT